MGFNRVWGGPDSIAASHKWEEKKYFEKERKKEKKRNELIRPGLTTARTVMFHRFLFSVWRLFFLFFFTSCSSGAKYWNHYWHVYQPSTHLYANSFLFFFSCPVMYIYFFSGWFLFALLSLDLFVVGLPTGRRREVMCDANASVRHFFSGPHSPKRKKKIT